MTLLGSVKLYFISLERVKLPFYILPKVHLVYRMIIACTHCSMQCYSDEASLNWPSIQAKQITLFVFSRRNKADHQNNGQVFLFQDIISHLSKGIQSVLKHFRVQFFMPIFAHAWCDTLYQVHNPTGCELIRNSIGSFYFNGF